jgi:hypothetical protein
MKYSSFPGERLVLADPTDHRLRRKAAVWDHVVAALTDPEFIALILFCALGLVVTIGLCILIPDFGKIAASPQAFL